MSNRDCSGYVGVGERNPIINATGINHVDAQSSENTHCADVFCNSQRGCINMNSCSTHGHIDASPQRAIRDGIRTDPSQHAIQSQSPPRVEVASQSIPAITGMSTSAPKTEVRSHSAPSHCQGLGTVHSNEAEKLTRNNVRVNADTGEGSTEMAAGSEESNEMDKTFDNIFNRFKKKNIPKAKKNEDANDGNEF